MASKPVPDPTSLTTEALQREIAALKELVFTRLDGNDKALKLLGDQQSKVPSETTKEVSHLKELILTRFAERDLRSAQQTADAKEALSKAEESLNKRFDIAEVARSSLEERTRMMMPRTESESLHKAHTDRINGLVSSVSANTERRQGAGQSWHTIVTIVTATAAIATSLYAVAKLAGAE